MQTSLVEIPITPGGQEPEPIKTDPFKEYVSGSPVGFLSKWFELGEVCDGYARPLTYLEIDSIKRDAQVAACIGSLIEGALGEVQDVAPEIEEGEPGYERSKEIADFLKRTLFKRPDWSFRGQLKKMLEAAYTDGHKIAEKVYGLVEDPADQDDGKTVLERLSVKPRGAVTIVVSDKWEILGYRARVEARDLKTNAPTPATQYPMLSPEHFVILTHHAEDEDPRGNSAFDPIRAPALLKSQVPKQALRYIVQLALPIFLGFTAQNQANTTTKDVTRAASEGEKPSPAAVAMLQALQALQGMMAAVFPNGAEVEVVKMDAAASDVFGKFNDSQDKQIHKGLLFNELSNRDAEHQTKSSTGDQMSVVDVVSYSLRLLLEDMVNRQIIRPLVFLNYGSEALAKYCPCFSLGDTERRNFETTITAIGNFFKSGAGKLVNLEKLFAVAGLELSEDWMATFEKMISPVAANADGGPGAPGPNDKGSGNAAPGSAGNRSGSEKDGGANGK